MRMGFERLYCGALNPNARTLHSSKAKQSKSLPLEGKVANVAMRLVTDEVTPPRRRLDFVWSNNMGL